MLQNKLIFTIFIAVFAAHTVVSSDIRGRDRNCDAKQLEVSLQRIAELANPVPTVFNKSDLESKCPAAEDALKFIFDSTPDCISPDHELAISGTMFEGYASIIQNLCKNETYQEKYLEHIPCLRNVSKENQGCLEKFTKVIERVQLEKVKAEPDKTLRNICCSVQESRQCSINVVTQTCGEETAEFNTEFLEALFSSIIQQCPNYTKEECSPVLKELSTTSSTKIPDDLS